MGRKLLAILLAFTLLLSMCSTALASQEGEVRETDFFTDQPHADLDFSEIKYKRVDAESVLAQMEELRSLLDDAANSGAAEERFNLLTGRLTEAMTMYSLAEIMSCQNASDGQAAQELEASYSACLTISDGLTALVRDILSSPCSAFLTAQLSEAEANYYLAYRGASKTQLAQSSQEAALESEYRQAAAKPCTAEYFGREWNIQSLNQAYYGDGSIDAATYAEVYGMLVQEQNEALGQIYLRMVKLRNSIAASRGYGSYGDYAYRRLYGRDYTPKDIAAFREDVKEHIVPLYIALQTLSAQRGDVYFADYGGDVALDMMAPYIGQMSNELLEAFSYMREHHLYDTAASETKEDTGFTAILYSYGAPFFFNAPANELFDFVTTVHEFGHYNNAYWQKTGWNEDSKSIDVMEVHSQGLELLFSHYYPDIFQKDAAEVLDYQIVSLVAAICQGAYYDELQQYVYSEKNLTLEKINQEARRLSVEYGFAEEDSPMAGVYGLSWVLVSHNFTSPFYYISYAVSAAGAFTFWLDAQKDYFSAVDSYLAFTALDASYGFQESFTELGLSSPLSSGYLEKLSRALWPQLRVEARLEALASATVFSDVSADSWYAPYVLALAGSGCIAISEDKLFRPNEAVSWGTAMGALLALTGQTPELEDGGTITRQEFCQLIAEVLDIPAAESPSPFTDTQDGAVAALAEMGVISGYSDGTFRPDGTLTRAEMCVILYRAAVAGGLIEMPGTAAEAGESESDTSDTSEGLEQAA